MDVWSACERTLWGLVGRVRGFSALIVDDTSLAMLLPLAGRPALLRQGVFSVMHVSAVDGETLRSVQGLFVVGAASADATAQALRAQRFARVTLCLVGPGWTDALRTKLARADQGSVVAVLEVGWGMIALGRRAWVSGMAPGSLSSHTALLRTAPAKWTEATRALLDGHVWHVKRALELLGSTPVVSWHEGDSAAALVGGQLAQGTGPDTLLLVSRTVDATTPLLLDWTYAALVETLCEPRSGVVTIGTERHAIAQGALWDALRGTSFGDVGPELNARVKAHRARGGATRAVTPAQIARMGERKRAEDELLSHVAVLARLSSVIESFNLYAVSLWQQQGGRQGRAKALEELLGLLSRHTECMRKAREKGAPAPSYVARLRQTLPVLFFAWFEGSEPALETALGGPAVERAIRAARALRVGRALQAPSKSALETLVGAPLEALNSHALQVHKAYARSLPGLIKAAPRAGSGAPIFARPRGAPKPDGQVVLWWIGGLSPQELAHDIPGAYQAGSFLCSHNHILDYLDG